MPPDQHVVCLTCWRTYVFARSVSPLDPIKPMDSPVQCCFCLEHRKGYLVSRPYPIALKCDMNHGS
jgi:hypothetical protein